MLAHDCLLCVDVKLEYIYCVTLKLIYHFRLCRIAFVYVSTMNAMFSYGIFGGCMRNSMFNVTYKRHQNVKILAFGTFHSLAKLSVDICARVYVRACKCVRENVCVYVENSWAKQCEGTKAYICFTTHLQTRTYTHIRWL